MKKYTTSERLKQIMSERGLKQVDILRSAKPFCEKTGISLGKSSLNQYISGYAEPGQHKLYILGLALNVSEAWLMGYDVPIERTPSKVEIATLGFARPVTKKKLPMLGNVACGEPIFANEEHESYIEAGENLDADFCLTAKGDSMINARIFDGDLLFVKSQNTVDDGEIAVVLIDNEATVKRVYYDKENNIVTLVPENPMHKPLRFIGTELDQIRILGKVIAGQYSI